ncbi:alpha/beta fold hydrolase [Nocardiopsis sp. MG754419]|uniref:alpha/beta fold hydrolase n=1 Tax=Nocardiopsis sp. MG754419 TaxID=2259865 RepID=UPI001BA4D48D|nr:alpha/beta hydrolase [Nocardiopsis sp. MG754419]MBR8744568.1 alpha/beta hydrolase [Nocardiopsis sp. MG754419]
MTETGGAHREFHRTHVDMPEGRLSVIAEGPEQAPAVLLLSGAGVDSATLSWRHLIPELARDHRVIALDWPKQGLSTEWKGFADHAALRRCVLAVLDHFHLDRVSVVGMSQGGAMTLDTAIELPDRVERIVPINPGGILSFPPVYHQLLWLTAQSRLLNSTLPGLMVGDRRRTAAFVGKALLAGPAPDQKEIVDEVMAEMARHGAGSSDWQNASIGPWGMNVDLRPRLPEIACPALFIAGAKDIGVKPALTIAAARAVPGARVELLAGQGHWVNRQSPGRVNRLVRDFLTEPAAGA